MSINYENIINKDGHYEYCGHNDVCRYKQKFEEKRKQIKEVMTNTEQLTTQFSVC